LTVVDASWPWLTSEDVIRIFRVFLHLFHLVDGRYNVQREHNIERIRATQRFIKLAFHGADIDADTDSPKFKHGYSLTSDTRYFLVRILARKSRVSDVRMYRRVGRVGVSVRVGVVECQLYYTVFFVRDSVLV